MSGGEGGDYLIQMRAKGFRRPMYQVPQNSEGFYAKQQAREDVGRDSNCCLTDGPAN